MIRGGFVTLPENSAAVDPDEIKGQLPEYQAMVEAGDDMAAGFAHEESSTVSKQMIAQATANGFDAIMDGTGDSGIDKLRNKVQGYRANGHRVIANYAPFQLRLRFNGQPIEPRKPVARSPVR